MSTGTICLTCRAYIGREPWHCKCETPVPSDDGKTPNPARVFEFDRYRNGRKMAEGVVISRATTEDEARRIALTLYRSAADMGELRLRNSQQGVKS